MIRIVLAACLAAAGPLAGQQFEGVAKVRTTTLPEGALWTLLGEEDDPGPASEQEEPAWRRRLADRIFAIGVDRALGMIQSGELEDGRVVDNTMYIKGGKIRGEQAGDDSQISYSILDSETGAFILVSDAQRAYWRWGAAPAAGAARGPAAARSAARRPTVRDLGRTAAIHGRQCRAYEVIDEAGDIIRGWVSTEQSGLRAALSNFVARIRQMSGSEEDTEVDAEDLLWEKGIPVRIERVTFASGTLSRYEIEDIVSVEQRPVAASMFAAPAAYKEKPLSELFGEP